jgi:hypothetical protein
VVNTSARRRIASVKSRLTTHPNADHIEVVLTRDEYGARDD